MPARFSATAYCFAVAMNEILGIPVGVIACSWGGSHIAGWMPGELLRTLGYENVAAKAADEKRGNGRPDGVIQRHALPLAPLHRPRFLWYQGCSDVAGYKIMRVIRPPW